MFLYMTRLAFHSYFGCPTTIALSLLNSKVVEINIIIVVVVVMGSKST